MEIDLEKVEIVREKAKVSYAEAKEALEKTDGNVLDAIIYIEKNQKNILNTLSGAGNEFVESIKDIVKKGNVNRIKIKKDGKLLLDIPVNAGVVGGAIGVVYVPALLAIGAIAAMVSKIEVIIERPNGKIEVVEDIAKYTASDAEKASANTQSE